MLGKFRRVFPASALAVALAAAACTPAAQPSPTAAPAKPAATTAPAKPAATTAPAKPAASPAVKAAASPAASPAAKPAATPEAKPAATAAAKPAAAAPKPAATFNEQAVADFYRGKNLRIIVGFSAGGGYDTYARLISRHLSRHIPGNPNIIVENMPGAGSLTSANHIYSAAPKDGTAMATFIGGMITQKVIVGNPAAQFEPMQFNFVGGPTPDTAACAVRVESGFESLEQARQQELILGGTAPGSTTNDIPNTLKEALGLNIRLVDGYGGTADIRLAADRGEIHGGCWGWESISVTWKDALEANEVRVLGQGGARPHPDLQNVPHFLDIAQDDAAKRLIQAGIVGPGQISRVYALPPEVPEDRVAAIRAGFAAALEDPQLLADAGQSGLAINLVRPEEFYERVQELEQLPEDLKARLRAAIAP